MRNIVLLLFFMLICSYPQAYASDGVAQTSVSVQTTIEGQGRVYTHIHTNVNGKTQDFSANKPGTYYINNTTQTTPPPKSPSKRPQKPPKPSVYEEQVPSPLRSVLGVWESFLSRLLRLV